jgi:hypothetical protein
MVTDFTITLVNDVIAGPRIYQVEFAQVYHDAQSSTQQPLIVQ